MRSAVDIAYDVRQAMARKGFTQSQLALAIGVNQSQISRFRQGRFTLLSPNLLKLCEHLEIQVEVENGESPSLHELELARIMNRFKEVSVPKKRAMIRLLRALNDLLG